MKSKIRVVIVLTLISTICVGIYMFKRPDLKSITLASLYDRATGETISITTSRPASLFIEFWKEGDESRYRTISTDKDTIHSFTLPLLDANSLYSYIVRADGVVPYSSAEFQFTTREESPWLKRDWVRSESLSDSLLGDGLIMMCHSRVPGNISLVDAKGTIRWHWQVKDIGVRVATLTPRGTILAMLRPPKDLKDESPVDHSDIVAQGRPQRKGVLGFVGGTALAEIDFAGNMLWRVDLDKKYGDRYEIIHHDIKMDKRGYIHTIYRDIREADISKWGGDKDSSIGGDGIMVLDSLGNIVKRWSLWDHWDIDKDPMMQHYSGDRFHANGLSFDSDGNYLLSLSTEDQIWKIDAESGDVIWKLGINGDFKMEDSSLFAFQHAPYINSEGDLMLYDNGLNQKISRTLSFKLDTENMVATRVINAPLPEEKYSSRMGNGFLLPNGNILQTSSKRGNIFITDQSGAILWELSSNIIPYRAEFVPNSVWSRYFN